MLWRRNPDRGAEMLWFLTQNPTGLKWLLLRTPLSLVNMRICPYVFAVRGHDRQQAARSEKPPRPLTAVPALYWGWQVFKN
ncbi:hypothetical protein O3P69_019382 [Scylla paramamosain]|uniref:Uncharacterized protein n=1 Tax=Scylla paramamosain TaxID=85552 RepID=A0AAW0SWX3_SCYPA